MSNQNLPHRLKAKARRAGVSAVRRSGVLRVAPVRRLAKRLVPGATRAMAGTGTGTAKLPAWPDPEHDPRALAQLLLRAGDLLSGALADGPGGLIVLVIDQPATPEPKRGGTKPTRSQLRARASSTAQLAAAVGLAGGLRELGYGVTARTPKVWYEQWPAGEFTVLALAPGFDPARVPGGRRTWSWLVSEPERWLRHPRLTLFDAVLSAAAHLPPTLATLTDRPAIWFPLAADLASPPPRSAGTWRGREVAIRSAHATAGIVPGSVFDAILAGARPRPASTLGLAELDLAELASPEPGRAMPAAAGDPAARYGERIRLEHTYLRRAARLQDLLAQLPAQPLALPGAPTGGPADGTSAPVRLGFLPDFRATNPYQDMLYAALPAAGVQVVPLALPPNHLVPRDPTPATGWSGLGDYILHVHWTSAIVQDGRDEADAAARLAEFKTQVRQLRDRGGRLIWTIHNVLPHELRYFELERQLCQFLAAQADLIHVLGRATIAAAGLHFTLDRKRTKIIEHSSYLGIYPDLIDRAAARRRLGLDPDEFVLLALGGIRPYRGLDLLLTEFDRLRSEFGDLRLLVAGKPGDDPRVAQWADHCGRHPGILARFEHLPEAELQVWHKAADLAVLPYRAILNSGAFKLAQTFGLPIVGPLDGCLAESLDPSFSFGFRPDEEGSLGTALSLAVRRLRDPETARGYGAAALAAALAWRPDDMAAQFAAAVTELLRESAGPVGRDEDRVSV